MEQEEPQEHKMTFKITEVENKAIRKVGETIRAVAYSYHAIINYDSETHKPLEVDSLPIIITDPDSPDRPELKKDQTLNWLFKKAFEDLIIALTESLIEAHRYARAYSLSSKFTKSNPINSEKDRKEVLEINTRPLSLSFPALIDEIEREIKISLPLRDEVISINKVRNCLVHRNGIVNDKEITLSYVAMITWMKKGDQWIEVKREHKEKGFTTELAELKQRKKEIVFKIGEAIRIDQQVFNDLAYTCIAFVQDLLKAMPGFVAPPTNWSII